MGDNIARSNYRTPTKVIWVSGNFSGNFRHIRRSIPLSSFPRRRESSEKTFLIRSFVAYWIPAFAGMTDYDAALFLLLYITERISSVIIPGLMGSSIVRSSPALPAHG